MKLNVNILQAFVLLNSQSSNNYLVGGSVRDYLLGKTPHDFDIVTDVPMDTIESLFAMNGWKVDATGKSFLVMNVSKDGQQYEIANFRKDGDYSDGRRPDSVEIGSLEEDAQRRDFTVNAIYFNPFSGKLMDPQNGRQDLEAKRLRFIGRPKDRIKEDYLRIFRFYRFLTKGFTADKKSLKACREYFNEAYLQTTPERVRVEIERMVNL